MKYILKKTFQPLVYPLFMLPFGVFLMMFSACSTPAPTLESVGAREAKIFEIYEKDPKSAIKKYKTVAKDYEKLGNGRKTSTAYLNIANIYDERLGNNEKALEYAQYSYNAALATKDSFQMANLLKYRGLLEGRLQRFAEAEQHVKEAIDLYTIQKFKPGIAVSQFDLANVMYEKGDYGKSSFLLNLANEYWRYQNDYFRLFVNHIFGMKLYDKMKLPDKVKSLHRECEDLKKKIKYEGYVKDLYESTVKMLNIGN